MSFTFDFANEIINASSDQTTVECQDLIDAIRAAEASAAGIVFPSIANASGKQSLGTNVAVGITIELLDDWQVIFPSGSYIATITGGNLVGATVDPVAYSPGVQIMLVQSAASTIVVSGGTSSALTDAQAASLTQAQNLLEADQVYDSTTGLLHYYRRGTTTDLIPAKQVTGTSQQTSSEIAQT